MLLVFPPFLKFLTPLSLLCSAVSQQFELVSIPYLSNFLRLLGQAFELWFIHPLAHGVFPLLLNVQSCNLF